MGLFTGTQAIDYSLSINRKGTRNNERISMASHCTPETASTISAERVGQDVGVSVAYCDDESVSGHKSCFRRRQKSCWIGAVVIFVLVGIATITVVALGPMSGKSGSESGSEAPRESDAYYQERLADFRSLVGRWSETSVLVQTGSPQAQALDWLVYQDRTLSHKSIDETALKQRYAIMVLYYACGGEGWQSFDAGNLEAQSATPTCEWVGDKFIDCDAGSKEVTILDLSARRMVGTLPAEVSLLTSLETLGFSFNFLEGTLPDAYFDTLTNLSKCALTLSGFRPASRHRTHRRLHNLHFSTEMMLFDKNEFAGTLSSKVGQLSQLEVLSLGENFMTGTLPDELGQLKFLQELFLQDNGVEGPFFDQFGTSWPDLRFLVLDQTMLTGTIPETISMWNLQELSLVYAGFKGPFPSSAIESMSNLEYINVGSKELTGPLPDFSSLTKLGRSNIKCAHPFCRRRQ